ncbi:hypothetical protein Bbelb_246380 [Branchiostoma belcheri]|nr:hypothetical protein Bbelb_246380 [Branchiostoma belcheri]
MAAWCTWCREDSFLRVRWLLTEPDKRRLDQSRPEDQMNTSIEDYYLDMTREDWTRSGDLETQEQDDNNIHRLDETADFEVEDCESEEFVQKPVMTAQQPFDLKMQKEMKTSTAKQLEKTAGTVVTCECEPWDQTEWKEEPDFYWQICVKEDGEV